jgi:hypothetical protein
MLFIGFKGGPFDGETRTYLRPQPAETELYQSGSDTAFVYRLYQTLHGPRYIFERAYRPATQEAEARRRAS